MHLKASGAEKGRYTCRFSGLWTEIFYQLEDSTVECVDLSSEPWPPAEERHSHTGTHKFGQTSQIHSVLDAGKLEYWLT